MRSQILGGGALQFSLYPSFQRLDEMAQATLVATAQLNQRAKPWLWGRPPKTRCHLHRLFCYRL